MNINDILVLCRAGFTAEQIGKMSTVTETPPAPGASTPTAPGASTPPAPGASTTTPANVNADIVNAIADLKQAIVNSNITNSNQPAPRVDTVDSIINSMIGGNNNGGK